MTDTVLPFPIQIGVIGAPGSGKQKVIEKYQELASEWYTDNDSSLEVVANAGNVIQDDFDLAMGAFGGWEMDMRAFWNRVEREDQLRMANKSFIASGTAIEHLAHCGVNLESLIMGIQTPDQQQRVESYKVGMMALTFLFLGGFRYHFGFYIPHTGTSLIVPGADQTENNYGMKVDNGIRQIFGNFGLRIQVLEGSSDEQAQEMFDTVKRIVENGPDAPPDDAEEGQDQRLPQPEDPQEPSELDDLIEAEQYEAPVEEGVEAGTDEG